MCALFINNCTHSMLKQAHKPVCFMSFCLQGGL
jgi:hypothetical protein